MLRELGAGGLGSVYLARHESLGRDVAIKLMHAEVAARPEYRQRFEREARALGQLRHPNIVTVLDFGIEQDTNYLVMELAEGETLDRFLESTRCPLDVGIAIVRQLLRALAYAHAQKVVHRDLKPANIIVRRLDDGSVHVVVLDFGIAKMLGDDSDEPPLTKQGAILGTPAYMAPEQATGSAPKPTVDVYAAGLVAFEVLAGRRPFVETDRAALLRAQVMTPPPPPSSIRPELAPFDTFLLKALEKKPVHRFADAAQMLEAFERIAGAGSQAEARVSSLPDASWNPPAPAPASPTLASTGPGWQDVPVLAWLARRPLLLAAGVGGVLALGGAAFVLISAPAPTPLPIVLPPPIVAPGASAEPRTSPLDRGAPPEIAELHATILAGGQPSRNALTPLYRYNALHREDPRGELLLGRTYADRRWFTDSIEAYEKACRIDPSSAQDARLRSDLLRFAPLERFGPPAVRLIESCLGPSAIPEVEQALAGARDAQGRARLSELLSRLRAR